MKIAFILGLSFFCNGLTAQKKGSWYINVSTGFSANTSPYFKNPGIKQSPNNQGGGFILLDSTAWQLVYTTYKQALNNLVYKSSASLSFTAGTKFSYPVNKRLDINTGVGFGYLSLKRVAQNESAKYFPYNLRGFRDSLFVGTPSNPVFAGTTSTIDNYPTRYESFYFVTLNLPVTATYKINKICLEGGVSTSMLVKTAKQKAQVEQNPEITFTEPEYHNNTTVAFALTFTPSYQLTNNFQLGLEYNHWITNLIDAENYRPILARSVSVKLAYKL